MGDGLTAADLDEIERRLRRALDVAPQPWVEFLETREGTGGGSFVRLGEDPELDQEMYVDIHVGTDKWSSPDSRLDEVVDFIGHAPGDVRRLLQEVRRLRDEPA
ncbi:hypothetical protein [Lentzea sp. NPDC051838]|uniref:hypothetical protein n=1 Tax=Lentzea sp. NPDC051838 TaxID=3154849 RepID=UPI0034339091